MIQVLPIVIGIVFFVLSIALSSYSEYIGWNKGFDSGWKAASKRFVDYDLGFKDGWQAAKEEDS